MPRPVPVLRSPPANWMDSWCGLGAVVAGMNALGFNIDLKGFAESWRVNFYPVFFLFLARNQRHAGICVT